MISCMIKLSKSSWKLTPAWMPFIKIFNISFTFMKIFFHDDVIKWRHFPHHWPFVRGIHRSLVNSPHKGQWRGSLMFSLICTWINRWVNYRGAGDMRCYCAHYDITAYRTGKPETVYCQGNCHIDIVRSNMVPVSLRLHEHIYWSVAPQQWRSFW